MSSSSRWPLASRPIRRSVRKLLLRGLLIVIVVHALAILLSWLDPTQVWRSGFVDSPNGVSWRISWQGDGFYDHYHIESREHWEEWLVASGNVPGESLEIPCGRELPASRNRIPRWINPPRTVDERISTSAYGWPMRHVYSAWPT